MKRSVSTRAADEQVVPELVGGGTHGATPVGAVDGGGGDNRHGHVDAGDDDGSAGNGSGGGSRRSYASSSCGSALTSAGAADVDVAAPVAAHPSQTRARLLAGAPLVPPPQPQPQPLTPQPPPSALCNAARALANSPSPSIATAFQWQASSEPSDERDGAASAEHSNQRSVGRRLGGGSHGVRAGTGTEHDTVPVADSGGNADDTGDASVADSGGIGVDSSGVDIDDGGYSAVSSMTDVPSVSVTDENVTVDAGVGVRSSGGSSGGTDISGSRTAAISRDSGRKDDDDRGGSGAYPAASNADSAWDTPPHGVAASVKDPAGKVAQAAAFSPAAPPMASKVASLPAGAALEPRASHPTLRTSSSSSASSPSSASSSSPSSSSSSSSSARSHVSFDPGDFPIPDFEATYQRMRDSRTGIPLGDRRWRFATYHRCFIGREAVTWMQKRLSLSRADAVALGRQLMDAGVIHHVTYSEPFQDAHLFYAFQEDDASNVLNIKLIWDSSRRPRHPVQIAQELLTRLALLCEEYRLPSARAGGDDGDGDGGSDGDRIQSRGGTARVSSDGGSSAKRGRRKNGRGDRGGSGSGDGAAATAMTRSAAATAAAADRGDIDYEALRLGEDFRRYVFATAELQRVDLSGLSHEEKLCFFCNVYNALCLHGHIVKGAPNTVLRRWNFFMSLSYRIAGVDFSLDDIEHGVLRGNQTRPYGFIRQFRPGNPRMQYVLHRRDARVHFVISAGTQSDPPMRLLDGENVEEEMHFAAEDFLDTTCTVRYNASVAEVVLPRIFSWYRDDFVRGDRALLRWLAPYLGLEKRRTLQQMLGGTSNSSPCPISIRFETFHWNSTEARFNATAVRRKRRRLDRERSQQRRSPADAGDEKEARQQWTIARADSVDGGKAERAEPEAGAGGGRGEGGKRGDQGQGRACDEDRQRESGASAPAGDRSSTPLRQAHRARTQHGSGAEGDGDGSGGSSHGGIDAEADASGGSCDGRGERDLSADAGDAVTSSRGDGSGKRGRGGNGGGDTTNGSGESGAGGTRAGAGAASSSGSRSWSASRKSSRSTTATTLTPRNGGGGGSSSSSRGSRRNRTALSQRRRGSAGRAFKQ